MKTSEIVIMKKIISLKSIENSAFEDCALLAKVVLPDSITTISNYTFWNCPELASIIIPNRVDSIGYYAFAGCEKLKTIINLSEIDIQRGSEAYGEIAKHAEVIINAPNGSVEGDFVFGTKDGGYTMYKYLGESPTI